MIRFAFLFSFIALLLSPAFAADNEIAPQLRRVSVARSVGTETLRYSSSLARFYQDRQFQPAWSDGYQLLPSAAELLASLPAAAGEGLDPRTYHLFVLTDLFQRFSSAPTPQIAAELDLLLSDAFMSLSSHYLNGRTVPAQVDRDWHIPREQADPLRMLNQALTSGRINDSLQALLPPVPAYAALRRAWQDLQLLAAVGGWPRLTFKPPLRPGASGAEVVALRQRLVVSGDLPAAEGQGEIFDTGLEAAVWRFQSRHGLLADRIVGPQTLAALNVPASERARQLAVNLERWRWLPRFFGERHLRVNLPAFHLELIENGESILDMRVIVGRQLRQTPAFVGSMTYLVLNPYWEVPRNLAVLDLIPKIQADVGYLDKNGIKVFTRPGGTLLNPAAINWQQLGAGNFPYHLRQDPGPKNALGRIKFMFPNRYTVYLHDTPTPKLFEREERSFSSGCIRIEKPFALAQLLLRGTPLASPASFDAALQDAVSAVVLLPTPVPVYLLYFTAWVEVDGTLNFRNDLYKRDHRLAAALQ
ncbi:MAG: peptidoglycan-binding protein [Deltaproteobacteria bacterium HGW-Deltaproteobacteria-4]|nr:MAG: peptidoglycan-binding protein [Deltaproteobacteria bacterium HGW-Deltaproteobacteria-4]